MKNDVSAEDSLCGFKPGLLTFNMYDLRQMTKSLRLKISTSIEVKAFNYSVQVQFSSVSQPCPTLCDPMNRSMPGLPVHHQLPEFT